MLLKYIIYDLSNDNDSLMGPKSFSLIIQYGATQANHWKWWHDIANYNNNNSSSINTNNKLYVFIQYITYLIIEKRKCYNNDYSCNNIIIIKYSNSMYLWVAHWCCWYTKVNKWIKCLKKKCIMFNIINSMFYVCFYN